MTIFKSLFYAVGASALLAFSAQAVPVQYQLTVEAELEAVSFGPAISRDRSSGGYQRYNSVVYSDASSSALDGFRWIEDARATTGTLEFIYDADNPSATPTTFSSCTGVLRSMCSGSVTRVSDDLGGFSNSDGFSFLTNLNGGTLRYTDDLGYTWDDGTRQFSTMGYGVNVLHNISSLSIAAVPLSSSFGFLLGAFGLLFAARRVSRRA